MAGRDAIFFFSLLLLRLLAVMSAWFNGMRLSLVGVPRTIGDEKRQTDRPLNNLILYSIYHFTLHMVSAVRGFRVFENLFILHSEWVWCQATDQIN